jgi:rubrerythrin
VGKDEDNLREAIAGERYEVETMYPSFAQQARLAGEAAAAERFTEIRDDESDHLAAFQRALEQLEQGAQDIRHEQIGAAG